MPDDVRDADPRRGPALGQLAQHAAVGVRRRRASAASELADAVYAPENVRGATLVVAIVGEAGGIDVGRCAQNMMLAAWNDGVVSCPNGIKDPEAAAQICGGEVKAILSFGYPAKPRDPESRSAEEWSARANRKPLDELVRRV